MDKYVERVISFLEQCEGENYGDATEDSQLIADLGINSIELLQIVNDAEDEFDIEISDAELEELVTVGDVAALLEKKGVEV